MNEKLLVAGGPSFRTTACTRTHLGSDVGRGLHAREMRRAAGDQLDRIEDAGDVAFLLEVEARRYRGTDGVAIGADADQHLVLAGLEGRPGIKVPGREAGQMLAQGLAVEEDLRAEHGLVDLQSSNGRHWPIETKSPAVPERIALRVLLGELPPVGDLGTRRVGKWRRRQRRQTRHGHGAIRNCEGATSIRPSAICQVPSSEITLRAPSARPVVANVSKRTLTPVKIQVRYGMVTPLLRVACSLHQHRREQILEYQKKPRERRFVAPRSLAGIILILGYGSAPMPTIIVAARAVRNEAPGETS